MVALRVKMFRTDYFGKMTDNSLVKYKYLKTMDNVLIMTRRSFRMLKKRVHLSEQTLRRAQAGDFRVLIQPAALPLSGVKKSGEVRQTSGYFSRKHETVDMEELSKRSERHHGFGVPSSIRNSAEKLSPPERGKLMLVDGIP